MQFSQQMQQFPPRPTQPSHVVPSSQAKPAQYVQTYRPFIAGSPQSQHTGHPMNNHMPGLGTFGMPLYSSYTFAPSPYGPQSNLGAPSQFQPMPQMHAPVPGQPWMFSANHSASLVTAVQQSGQQLSAISSTDSTYSRYIDK